MADYRGFLANCLVRGAEFSDAFDGRRVRNLIRVTVDAYELEIYQHPDIILNPTRKWGGQFVQSTEVVVRDVKPANKTKVDRLMTDLADLLALATLSPVAFYGSEYPDGSGAHERFSVIATANERRPTLDNRGDTIQAFLQQTWSHYRKLRRRRKLSVAIDLLVQAEVQPKPVELMLLTVFVALENLKSTYASDRRIPFSAGFFRKPAPPHVASNNAPKYSFRELLTMMFKDVKLKKGLTRIIRLRNDIIHSAISQKPYQSQWRIYEECHDLAKLYILRLLGYKGLYWSARTGGLKAT